VIGAKHPFIVPVDGAALAPIITEHANASNPRSWRADEPLRTQCAMVKGGHFALAAPVLVNTRNGERDGQQPRVRPLDAPAPTITAQGSQGALAAAFLARHYGGHENDGAQLEMPLPTVTTQDHHALVASHLTKLKGTSKDGLPLTVPMHTIQAGGQHYAEVRAFLVSYYGQGTGQQLALPMRSVTTHDRFGLVTVEGVDYAIVDIGMRMLLPRELFRAQGFPDSYIIDPLFRGKPLSKTGQVKMCGNSVSPYCAEALVKAQLGRPSEAVA
jgi:DNA (cytosine-5)-methyltransferase 1